MLMPLFHDETGKKVGDLEIPDDILEAAAKVSQFMEQHEMLVLYGLQKRD